MVSLPTYDQAERIDFTWELFIKALNNDGMFILWYEKADFMLVITHEQDGDYCVGLLIEDRNSLRSAVQHIQAFKHPIECYRYVKFCFNTKNIRLLTWKKFEQLNAELDKKHKFSPMEELVLELESNRNTLTRHDS